MNGDVCDSHALRLGSLLNVDGWMPLRLPVHPDEPVISYVARLAVAAGYFSIKDFLSRSFPWPLTPQDLAEGRGGELVARFSCLPADVFDDATPVWAKEQGAWRFRSEKLSRANGFGSGFRICPVCLDQDLEAARSANGGNRIAPHLRAVWGHPLVTACPHHRIALLEPTEPIEFVLCWNDINWRYAHYRKPRPQPSQGELLLSRFIAGRLGFGERLAEPDELALLPLDGALDILREIGVLLLSASDAEPTDAEAADRDQALPRALERTNGLRLSLAEILELLAQGPVDRRLKTPAQAFGGLRAIASRGQADARYEAFETRLGEAALKFTEADLSDPLFRNVSGDDRTRFNRSRLPELLGIGPNRLETTIRIANATAADCEKIQTSAKIITVEQLDHLRAQLSDLLTLEEAAEVAGLDVNQFNRLRKAKPFPELEGVRPYRRFDIQSLASDLCSGLPHIENPRRGETCLRHVLATAEAKEALSFLERLLGGGDTIRRTALVQTSAEVSPRLGDLVVNADDVYERTKPPLPQGQATLIKGTEEVAAYLGCKPSYELLAHVLFDPAADREQRVAFFPDLKRVSATAGWMDEVHNRYVLLKELTERLGRGARNLIDDLAAKGVHPTVPLGKASFDATYFPRAAAEIALGLRQGDLSTLPPDPRLGTSIPRAPRAEPEQGRLDL